MTKPTALPIQFDNIPHEIKKVPRWVVWKFVAIGDATNPKWSKIPFSPSGKAASTTNEATWSDYFNVVDAYNKGTYDGVGFVFCADDDLVGVDLDNCYDATQGTFTNPALQHIADNVEGYLEVSPSGTGVKLFTRSNLAHAFVDHALGLEIYNSSRYFTITGHKLKGEIPDEPQDLSAYIPERTIQDSGDDFMDFSAPLDDWPTERIEKEILPYLDDMLDEYTGWLTVGMGLHHQYQGSFLGLELWDKWSQGSSKYDTKACGEKWATFRRSSGATLKSLIFHSNQVRVQAALNSGEIILDVNTPYISAEKFLEAKYSSEEGLTLVHYAGDFHLHVSTHYRLLEESTVRSELYKFLQSCKKVDRKGNVLPFSANQSVVTNIIDALKAQTHLEQVPQTSPPVWLPAFAQNKPVAEKLVSMKNGLFHLEQEILLPHSLGFFNQHSLPFEYDPQAECPQWRAFLSDIWEGDQETIECLQEIFGYILSGDTMQQKFFNIIGPKRSGKGSINRVLVDLLGQHNTVAPQLEELTETFGLQSWIGKPLASFTDCRAPDRGRSGVVSQLLRIVGGDTVTVNRKNREAWNGYLPTRIVMYSNEALQLTENSGALTGRMIVLKMSKSFFGKEDTTLTTKLRSELPGIFNWSLEGLRRRLARGGQFLQPATGNEYLDLMQELGNPIGSFVEDALEMDPMAKVSKDDVFSAYKHWALKKSLPPGTELAFKRRFLAAVQEHHVIADLERNGGARQHVYRGVKLNPKAQNFVDSIKSFDEEIF